MKNDRLPSFLEVKSKIDDSPLTPSLTVTDDLWDERSGLRMSYIVG